MRALAILFLALAALVAAAAAQESCGLQLTTKATSRSAKVKKLRRGQLKLKFVIENLKADTEVTDAAFTIALPAGVSVSQMSFKPTTGPSPRGPILENGNATWVGVAVRAAKKRKVKLTVDTTGAAPNTPLVFQAWAYRHDGQSPLPCEGSTVTTQ